MTVVEQLRDERMLRLVAPDGTHTDYPYIWLRDNCPTAWHPETLEKAQDLLSVSPDAAPRAATIEGEFLIVDWEGEDLVSRFPLSWLAENTVGTPLYDAADLEPVQWKSDVGKGDLPQAEAAQLMADDHALFDWLQQTRAWGISLVTGIADDPKAGMAIAERVGFLRETNFGRAFEVKSKPNPNNLAYTAHALPLHTDLPNQELPPGVQFLHCLANEAVGGGSVFADGIAIAEDLRRKDPAAFELLSTQSIPFRFHDTEFDIRTRQKVINLDEKGAVVEICWSNHLAGVFDMDANTLSRYYPAFRTFMAAVRDPAYTIQFALKGGEMVVFDNRRILHGRSAFDPSTGYRYLHGFYVDRGEFDSRIRILAARRAEAGTIAA